jgi:hypothetical protein
MTRLIRVLLLKKRSKRIEIKRRLLAWGEMKGRVKERKDRATDRSISNAT